MTAVHLLLVLAVVLVVAAAVAWTARRRRDRPDDAIAEFARALEALRPDDDPVRLVHDDAEPAGAGAAPADDRSA